MKTVGMIIARLGSTRLPQKAIRPLFGQPMIGRLIERVKHARSLEGVALVTTTLPEDEKLVALADAWGCLSFRGSPDNVSQRIADAAQSLSCETVVELLADNPLIHSDLIDDVVDLYRSQKSDYAASVTVEYSHLPETLKRFPIGIRVQAYSARVASRWNEFPQFLNSPLGTTAFMFRQEDQFRCAYLEAQGKWGELLEPQYHLAVNYQKNFDLIERIFADLYPMDSNFSLPQVVRWMKNHQNLHHLMGS